MNSGSSNLKPSTSAGYATSNLSAQYRYSSDPLLDRHIQPTQSVGYSNSMTSLQNYEIPYQTSQTQNIIADVHPTAPVNYKPNNIEEDAPPSYFDAINS